MSVKASTHTHLVHGRKIRNAAQMCDPACMHDSGPNIVNQLVLDQVFAVPQSVEDFAYGQRCRYVLTNEFERLLILGWRRVLHPEQMVGLQGFAQATNLNGCEPVMHIMQQVNVRADCLADSIKQLGRMHQVFL